LYRLGLLKDTTDTEQDKEVDPVQAGARLIKDANNASIERGEEALYGLDETQMGESF
jgi:hypothetical protein